MRTKHLPLIVLACSALIAAVGCKPPLPGSDIQSTGAGDRHIRVLIEGGAQVQAEEAGFTVKLPGHELVIGKEQLLIDKVERAKFPADAKRFQVTSKGGTLTVNADGAEILRTPLKP